MIEGKASTIDPIANAADDEHGRRLARQQQLQILLERASHLLPEDHLLVRQVLEMGLKPVDLARQMQCSRGYLYRRLRTLVRRMRSPLYIHILAIMPRLDTPLRQVARRVVLQGLTFRDAAARTGLTMHEVRRHMITLHAMHAAVKSLRPRRPRTLCAEAQHC